MLHYTIIFSVLLMTALNVHAQCDRPVLGENRILIEETDQQTFLDGTTLKIKCSTGYVPKSGSRSITCSGTQWSDPELQCKKRSCGHPGEIGSGKYLIPDGIEFGATITAVCNEGYLLVSKPNVRHCRENGWDGRTPQCEVVKCPKPPSITNGTFKPEEDSYGYGEVVTYSCNHGINLFGSSTITCSNDGTFQPDPPRCVLVSCEKPDIPNAFRIEGKSPPYKYKNFVRYQCDESYRLEGSDVMTCEENEWKPPLIHCIEITCNASNVSHASIVGREKPVYKYKMSIQYQCDKGYRMEGSGSLTCLKNGWNAPPPKCNIVTCPKPSAINNGQLILTKDLYEYGQTVTYSCNKGYKPQDPQIISCSEDGTFHPSPLCVEVTCGAPNVIHASIVGTEKPVYKYKMSIQYWCDKGYNMEGSGSLTCEENGWNAPPPKCNIVTCPKPSAINNGQLILTKDLYEYGQTVPYSCNKGYKPQDPQIISCSEDGTIHPSPLCVEVFCNEPTIVHGYISEGKRENYNYESSIRIQCNSVLYQMEGSEHMICMEEGWRPDPPHCHYNPFLILVIVLVIVLIVVGFVIFACVYKKITVKSEGPKPEYVSLVKVDSNTPTADGSSSKNVL